MSVSDGDGYLFDLDVMSVDGATDATNQFLVWSPGPGSIAQAHTCDEWVAIDQLDAACEILAGFLRESAASSR